MPPLLWIVLGLVALVVGAELVVRYGAHLARQLRIPPIIVGLTIVSIGTSAPELAVGIDAVVNNAGSLAVGNIAGTNIVNILLILGLSAAISPILLSRQVLRLHLPVMVGVSLLVLLFGLDGHFAAWEGIILIVLAVAYTVAIAVFARRDDGEVAEEFADEYAAEPERGRAGVTILRIVLLLAGLAIIVFGAEWLVEGAVGLARAAGVSEALIGLTIVAIGTSAPELATTIISTIRGNRDVAIGNLIGSSTFNLTLILGVSLLFAGEPMAVDPQLVAIDLPIMAAVAVLCIPVFLTRRRISRGEGIAFVLAYAAYLTFLIVTRV